MADRPLSERLADLLRLPIPGGSADTLAEAVELARRVERAPFVEVKAAGTDSTGDGACRVYAITTPEELAAAPPIIYRRCRVVEVAE